MSVNKVKFSTKFETDLLKYQKLKKGHVVSVNRSKTGRFFWAITDQLEITVFKTDTAKIVAKIDCLSENFNSQLRKMVTTEKTEILKKEKLQEELLEKLKGDFKQKIRIDFDESESILIFPTVFGIAFYSMVSGCVEKIIGTKEKGELIVGLSIFQGEKISNMKGIIGSGGVSSQMKEADPLILTWCFKKPKFCLFSNRMPNLEIKKGEFNPRDIVLEKVKQVVQTSRTKPINANHGVRKVILSTSLGDIYIKLFPEFAPKTVENFVTHAKNGYYDNCIVHRVVKGYIQTGDPLNDGTGGESIWGINFEDEICEELKHDRPFTVSMANSGSNTNGSQFFITTIPSPWLDKKHTIFGRVYKGTDVVTEIEYLKTDNFEKPLMDVRIFRIEPIN